MGEIENWNNNFALLKMNKLLEHFHSQKWNGPHQVHEV